MADYLGLIVALGIGLPLLAGALLLDARRRRRQDAELAAAPERDLPSVDAHAPAYITQDEIDAMPRPGGDRPGQSAQPRGTRVAAGLAHRDFATSGERAELNAPAVLMTGDPIETFREILSPVGSASRERPLVIVAPAIAPEVLTTLCANRRALNSPLALVRAEGAEMSAIHALVGGEVLSGDDLRAGYVPESALGTAERWTSDAKATWIAGSPPAKA